MENTQTNTLKDHLQSSYRDAAELIASYYQKEDVINSTEKFSQIMVESFNKGGKALIFGNGGSTCDALHFSEEFTGRYRKDRDPIAAIALTTDTSSITAISNDYSYNEIFSRQVKGLGKEGDVLYAISTSGNSLNVIEGINAAKLMKIKVIGVTGNQIGLMNNMCDELISVPSNRPDRIQEMHIAVGQIICEKIENNFLRN